MTEVEKNKRKLDYLYLYKKFGGGGGGTSDYNKLSNLPKISDEEVKGNKSIEDYGGIGYNKEDNISLKKGTKILGTDSNSTEYEIIGLAEYDGIEQTEVGSEHIHLNLNTSDNVTVDTPEGKKTLFYHEILRIEEFHQIPYEDLREDTLYLIYN